MALGYGMGNFVLETNGNTPELLLPLEPMGFDIDIQTDEKESLKWKDGLLVTAGSATSKTTFQLNLKVQALTWFVMQVALGELAGTTASVNFRDIIYTTVPASSPFEISDAAISTTNILASVASTGSWGKARPLSRVTTTPASANEFQVNTTDKKLIFHSGAANSPIAYRRLTAATNVPSVGAEVIYTTLNSFGFGGVIYGDDFKWRVDITKMNSIGRPKISITDVTEFDLAYKLIVGGSDRLPFKVYDVTGL
jgi:hypothetical protein